jgi:hypothetical protein
MGQHFAAVNLDKQEFVCPWCVGGVAKLWEWAANPCGAVFTLLLRKSDEGGGGDYYGYGRGCGEGGPIACLLSPVVGRWAGDRVALVGDYDGSRLWDELYEKKSFRNISRDLVAVWNDFIELDDHKLTFNAGCSCNGPSP